ncbi:MAG: type I restriction endonuclease, partial [Brevinema sp.]
MPKNRPEMQYVQAPTLIQFATMGWDILTEKEASTMREHDSHEPLLLPILQESLRQLNPDITPSEISTFISRLTSSETGNLTEDNHRVFDHITKGITINRIVDGRPEPRTFKCVDWVNIENNKLQAVAEFNYYGDRFDIVLFVNGIPLGLIECKSSDIQQGIKEINYYTDKHPSFFLFIQFTATISAMQARYGTVNAGAEFYSVWREDISPITWRDLSPEILSQIFSGRLQGLGENLPSEFSGERVELVAGIFNPCRFFNLIKYYVLNDGGIKKVPRYQQFFVVEESLKRLKKREGGVIWHTQGSGKSLTMALLAQNIFSRLEAPDAQIILVTDRINLDSQLFNTFRNCNINTIA